MSHAHLLHTWPLGLPAKTPDAVKPAVPLAVCDLREFRPPRLPQPEVVELLCLRTGLTVVHQ